jgi:hypothetical protein
MISFGQKIIGRNVYMRYMRFGHGPKRINKNIGFGHLPKRIKNNVAFGQLHVFGQKLFFRPKNLLLNLFNWAIGRNAFIRFGQLYYLFLFRQYYFICSTTFFRRADSRTLLPVCVHKESLVNQKKPLHKKIL